MSLSFVDAVDRAVKSLGRKSGTIMMPLVWFEAFRRAGSHPSDRPMDYRRGAQVIRFRGDRRLEDQIMALDDVEVSS